VASDEIDELQRAAAADPKTIGLAGGLPSPEQFPRRPLADAFVSAVDRPGAPGLQYGWPEGLPALRARIAARLRRRRLRISEDDVIITSGAQQAIALALSLICRPGDRIGTDGESYPAALELFRSRRVEPVATDMGARAWPRRLRALYVMPAVDNPRGRVAPAAVRRRLVGSRLPIIEDDAYADLCFDGPPGPSLAAAARERVFQVGSFSKTLCPGLRIGWLVPPPRLKARALRLKQDSDLQANSLAQEVMNELLGRPDFDFDDRLETLRRFYRLRATRLMAAVRRHLPRWRVAVPRGGFALWVEPDTQVDEVKLLRASVEEKVSFDPGSLFRPNGAASPLALRLCFSMTPSARFDEGVRRLARAFRRAR
jgi:2-aminoadipate transaminase